MAKKIEVQTISIPHHQDRFQKRVGAKVEQLREELPRRTNQLMMVAAVLIAIAGAFFYNQKSTVASARAEAEQLGSALVYNYAGDWQKEREELEKFLSTNPQDKLARAKAELLLGNIAYQMRDYDRAESAFRSAAENGNQTALVAAAARHGLASSMMQREQWKEAAAEWERFVADYGNRRGGAREQAAGTDRADESALVPDALYKLAVVQLKLEQSEKAKATCERILKSYSESRLAGQAEKLLATL